jgi:hypothetical protein
VFFDQLLRRLDHVAGQRNPVEVSDDERTAGLQDSPRLGGCARTIEPMPALPRRYQIELRCRQSSFFRRRIDVRDNDARDSIEFRRLLHQRRRTVEPRNFASAQRQSARNRPGAGAQIERAHSGF